MTMIRALDGLQQVKYRKESRDIYKCLQKRLDLGLVNREQWKRDKTCLWHEDWIVLPSDCVPALLKWTHESSGHVGTDRTLKLFKKWFRKGFWFALTCVCSLYMLLKTLLIFHNSK